MYWRFAAGVLLLLLQAGAIVRGRFAEDRYFCWAPYDQQTKYSLSVTRRGAPLSAGEVSARYRRPQRGFDNRSAHHIFDIIRRAEERLPESERADVVLHYSVNGRPEQTWRYPER